MTFKYLRRNFVVKLHVIDSNSIYVEFQANKIKGTIFIVLRAARELMKYSGWPWLHAIVYTCSSVYVYWRLRCAIDTCGVCLVVVWSVPRALHNVVSPTFQPLVVVRCISVCSQMYNAHIHKLIRVCIRRRFKLHAGGQCSPDWSWLAAAAPKYIG